MKADLIIYNARQLVTCASHGKPKKGAQMQALDIIENGAIVVNKNKILAVGETGEILREYESENMLDAGGRVVCPGFVECHTHLVFAGNRLDEFELKIKGADYLEILKNGGGILSTVRATREASLENLVKLSKERLDKILKLGVTTCEIKTGYGLSTESEFKMLDAILELNKTHPVDLIPTFLAAHAVPPEFKENPDDYVELICSQMIKSFSSRMLHQTKWFQEKIEKERQKVLEIKGRNKSAVTFGMYDLKDPEIISVLQKEPMFVDVFCEKNAFNLEQSRKVLETAKSFGFKLKAHVDEFTNLGGARMAIELGATSIDHLDAISDEEIKILAASETIGVVTPTVNFNFGAKDFADARKMIDHGCALAVSTDYNPGSAPCPSLPNAMAIACRYQKILPSEALNAATINAAFAVAQGENSGSLEIGKQADVLILNMDDYRQLAYEFGGNPVGVVIKKGEIIVT